MNASRSLSKVAVNPLPWVLGPDGFDLSPYTVRAAVAGISEAGFTAMHADVPAGWTADDYRAVLDDHGVQPAPGYFGAHFDCSADEVGDLLEAARCHAAVQAQLGLTEVFLASHLNPARIANPAVGADFDADRLALIIERIAAVAAAVGGEGVRPCFHPHVGSWIETDDEVRAMLDSIDAAILAFGPDTGHLFWGGSDPAKIMGDYADRVGAVHLKDVHRHATVQATERGDDYGEATNAAHVWTEPGRGDVDFDAVFDSLPADYSGWFVVEVDVPDLPSKEESTAESARWIAQRRTEQR
jgi:inosose dehydratase